jgi:hypothetical protein
MRRSCRTNEADLSALINRVGEAIDRFSAEELDAFKTDQDLFQYGRAAKELWKSCNLGDLLSTGYVIAEMPPIDWGARGAFNPRKAGVGPIGGHPPES